MESHQDGKKIHKHHGWMACLAIACYFFYTIMQLSLFNVASAHLSSSFQLNSIDLGLLSSIYLYSLALILLPAGYLLDCYSTRNISIITLLLSVISALIFAFADNITLIALYRIITGMANGFAFLASLRVAMHWFPHHAALACGFIISIGMSGGIFATNFFSYSATKWNWEVSLIINAVIGIVFWILIVIFLRDCPQDNKAKSVSSLSIKHLKLVATNLQNWLCGIYAGLLNLSVYLLGALWGNLYLTQKYNLSNLQAANIISMIFLGIIIGSPISGWFSDLIRRRKTPMLLGAFAATVVIVLIAYLPALSYPKLMLLFLLLGIVTSTQIISYPAIAESNVAQLTSTATGFAALVLNIIGAVAQPLFGWLLMLKWDRTVIDSLPIYSASDFHNALGLLLMAFSLAIVIAFYIRETRCLHRY